MSFLDRDGWRRRAWRNAMNKIKGEQKPAPNEQMAKMLAENSVALWQGYTEKKMQIEAAIDALLPVENVRGKAGDAARQALVYLGARDAE